MLKLSLFVVSITVSAEKVKKIIASLAIKKSKNLSFVDERAVKVAAVAYKTKRYKSLAAYIADINEYLADAVQKGAQIIAFPELISLPVLSAVPFSRSFLSLANPAEADTLRNNVVKYYSDFLLEVHINVFGALAEAWGVYVMAGSCYVAEVSVFYNRGLLFDPRGKLVLTQDKTFLSDYESENGFAEAAEITGIPLGLGDLPQTAILLGEEELFFEPFEIARRSGARLVLVGSALAKQHEMQNAVVFRASESQLYCVKSCQTGVDVFGQQMGGVSGVFGPQGGKYSGNVNVQCDEEEKTVVARLDFLKLGDSLNQYNSDYNPDITAKYAALMDSMRQKKTRSLADLL